MFILTVLQFITHPYTVPIWAALSALLIHFVNVWIQKSKNKIENRKIDVTETHGERQQTRDDFNAITDALRRELTRVKDAQAEANQHLEEANEETKKCEQRYFELATQYRELLRYCAALAKQVRELEAKVQAHVSHEKKLNNDKRRTNSETTGNPSGDS